jgi:hypothetical protein
VQAIFALPDAPDEPVARATWTGSGVTFEAEGEAVRSALERIFRRTPVVVDDPALRTAGTSGPVALPPGALQWFIAAARARGEAGGFRVLFSPSGAGAVGWDPAGTYRPFVRQIERIERDPSRTG